MPFCHKTLKAITQKPGYPKQLNNLGDHVRLRRLVLGLDQLKAGRVIGVTAKTISNWEVGRAEPELRYIPNLVEFLGYNPLPEAKTVGEALRRARLARGLSRSALARKTGVDEATAAILETDSTCTSGWKQRREDLRTLLMRFLTPGQ